MKDGIVLCRKACPMVRVAMCMPHASGIFSRCFMRWGGYPTGIFTFTWVRVDFTTMKFGVLEAVF